MKILINRKDGGVSIMTLTGEAVSVEAEVAKWAELNTDSYLSHRLVSEEDLPPTREFRNAWADSLPGSQVDIELVKAKDVALQKLRNARNEELDKLDKKLMIAIETNSDNVEDLKKEKQALRDVTEPLKALVVEGYSDESTLAQIRQLSTIGDL